MSNKQTALNEIFGDNNYTITPPNVILDIGNAKIVFDKQQIEIDDMLEVYIKLKNYLNTFDGVYL
jgi:hypothetical protein